MVADINPSSSNGPSGPEIPGANPPFFQRISTYIIGATGIIVALSYFFDKLPPFLHNVEVVYASLQGMLKPPPGRDQSAGMLKPDLINQVNNNTNSDINHAPEERPQKPNENCTDVISADYSVLPAKYSRTWNCPKTTEKPE